MCLCVCVFVCACAFAQMCYACLAAVGGGGTKCKRTLRVSGKCVQMHMSGAGIAQLVVLGLAVHSVVGSILLWGHFPVEGIFPLELTWVQTPFPQKLLRMRV